MKKKAPALARRFVRAPGAPFSDEDAQIIGTSLVGIAERFRVDDVRSLTARQVYQVVKSEPDCPLRPYYDWKDRSAAEKHRLSFTRKLIHSVREVGVVLDVKTHVPLFVSAETRAEHEGKFITQRRQVMRDDVLKHSPELASALASQVRQVENAIRSLESLLLGVTSPPPGLAGLVASWRTALEKYRATLAA